MRIHPEILGICLDAYPKALKIIEELMVKEKIRKDQIPAEDVMINPGGIARLIDYETGDFHHFSRYAFTNVGEGIAIEQFKGDENELKRMVAALTALSLQISADTSLKFDPNRIVGSVPGNPEDGGGAISIQFMPDNALAIYNLVKNNTREQHKLNVFDPSDSAIMAWIFLAIKGYWRNHELDIRDSLRRWNDSNVQIDTIYNTAVNYYNNFIRGKPEGTY